MIVSAGDAIPIAVRKLVHQILRHAQIAAYATDIEQVGDVKEPEDIKQELVREILQGHLMSERRLECFHISTSGHREACVECCCSGQAREIAADALTACQA